MPKGEEFFVMMEVYYDDDGKPHAWSNTQVCGNTVAELEETLNTMARDASSRPMLYIRGDKIYDAAEMAAFVTEEARDSLINGLKFDN